MARKNTQPKTYLFCWNKSEMYYLSVTLNLLLDSLKLTDINYLFSNCPRSKTKVTSVNWTDWSSMQQFKEYLVLYEQIYWKLYHTRHHHSKKYSPSKALNIVITVFLGNKLRILHKRFTILFILLIFFPFTSNHYPTIFPSIETSHLMQSTDWFLYKGNSSR